MMLDAVRENTSRNVVIRRNFDKPLASQESQVLREVVDTAAVASLHSKVDLLGSLLSAAVACVMPPTERFYLP